MFIIPYAMVYSIPYCILYTKYNILLPDKSRLPARPQVNQYQAGGLRAFPSTVLGMVRGMVSLPNHGPRNDGYFDKYSFSAIFQPGIR